MKKMLMLQHFPAPPPPRHWLPKELSESQVAQSFATTTNGNPIASPIVASCAGWRQATFWDTQEFVLRKVAWSNRPLRAWTRRSFTWCKARLGKFSLQVTLVFWAWTLFRTRLTQQDLLWIEKFDPLWPVCNYDSAVKHHCQSVCKLSHAPVCWNQGQPSPRFVWEWWVGRRSVRLLQAIIISYDKKLSVEFHIVR